MREVLLRHAGPMLAVTFEVEAPSRVAWIASGPAEARRLAGWVAESPARSGALADALDDEARAAAWSRTLALEPGGVAAAVVELLLRDVPG